MNAQISLREFARQCGVSLFAVQKAIAAGRITAVSRDAAGRIAGIDPVQAGVQWGASRKASRRTANRRAWELARRTYWKLLEEINAELRSGNLRPDDIDSWEPRSQL